MSVYEIYFYSSFQIEFSKFAKIKELEMKKMRAEEKMIREDLTQHVILMQ